MSLTLIDFTKEIFDQLSFHAQHNGLMHPTVNFYTPEQHLTQISLDEYQSITFDSGRANSNENLLHAGPHSVEVSADFGPEVFGARFKLILNADTNPKRCVDKVVDFIIALRD